MFTNPRGLHKAIVIPNPQSVTCMLKMSQESANLLGYAGLDDSNAMASSAAEMPLAIDPFTEGTCV